MGVWRRSHVQVFQKTVLEFREACYELFGFSIERIDIVGIGNAYRLRSVYAERQEDFLLFRVRDWHCALSSCAQAVGAGLQLVETPFSASIQDQIDGMVGLCDV